LTANEIARVNGRSLSVSRYRDVLETFARQRSGASDTALRHLVVDRLIDEELLIQRGLRLDLVRRSQRVRSALVQETLRAVIEGHPSPPPDTAALRRFYRRHPQYFQRAERVRARLLEFHDDSRYDTPSGVRARRARRALSRGRSFRTVRRRRADTPVVDLPRGMLRRSRLQRYVGDRTARITVRLEPGEVSDVIDFPGGHRLVHLLERSGETLPPFEEHDDLVRSVYERHREERLLDDWLRRRREESDVVVRPLPP